MKAFLVLLFISTFTFSPLASAQELGLADVAHWRSEIAANPRNALAHFNLAVLYHKAKKYDAALASYNKVIELGSPLAPVAIYYKALIYNKQGNKDEARAQLAKISIDTIPANLKKSVLALKNSLFAETLVSEEGVAGEENTTTATEKAPEKSTYVFLDLSAGYNSNPATVLDTSTTGLKADTTQQVKAGANYLLYGSGTTELRFNYYFSLTAFSKDTDYNYYYHQFSLPFAFYFDAYRVKLSPDYFVDNYGGKAYSTSTGGTFDFARHLESGYLGLILQGSQIKNKTDAYSYLSGTQQRVQIYHERQWTDSKTLIVGGYGHVGYTDTATLASSYSSYTLSVSHTKYLGNFELVYGIGTELKIYARAASDTKARVDDRTYLQGRVGYTFDRNFQIYADLIAVYNTSNFNTTATGDYNYQQTLGLVGLTFGF